MIKPCNIRKYFTQVESFSTGVDTYLHQFRSPGVSLSEPWVRLVIPWVMFFSRLRSNYYIAEFHWTVFDILSHLNHLPLVDKRIDSGTHVLLHTSLLLLLFCTFLSSSVTQTIQLTCTVLISNCAELCVDLYKFIA